MNHRFLRAAAIGGATAVGCLTAVLLLGVGSSAPAEGIPEGVLKDEQQRIATVAKVRPSVVAIFAAGGNNGGSGVVIDEEGYALTNYHVVAATGPTPKCGLCDGILYDAVLVGTDQVGDVALIKLLPKKPGNKFQFAKLGDSDKLNAGDWSFAMGNPFLLATDFSPTVTYGMVSGVHRYQPPDGQGALEYTDCIQFDTSINPGNSGGPLFNVDGELVGINGRGSFMKRGRVNSGAGYAISINQIKNFLGQLRVGMDIDHASLGATVGVASDDAPIGRLVVQGILDECDVARRGLEADDEVIEFAGRRLTSANQFKNILGIFPRGWRVPLVFRHKGERRETLVRLMGVTARDIDGSGQPGKPKAPQRAPGRSADSKSPAAKLYKAKAGFANFYFNKKEQDRLLADLAKQSDFKTQNGEWLIEAVGNVRNKKTNAKFVIREEKGNNETKTVVRYSLNGIDLYELDPLKQGQSLDNLKDPPGSGGLLLALYMYRQLLTQGKNGFVGEFQHGGIEPFYLPAPLDKEPDFAKQRVDAEVLLTKQAGIPVKWYFSPQDHRLLGFEVSVMEPEEDPCEVYLSDYRSVDGRMVPHHIEVRYGGKAYPDPNREKVVYADLQVKNFKTAPAK